MTFRENLNSHPFLISFLIYSPVQVKDFGGSLRCNNLARVTLLNLCRDDNKDPKTLLANRGNLVTTEVHSRYTAIKCEKRVPKASKRPV